MNRGDESRAWILTGALGALVLGVALIPLRRYTAASSFAFAFLAFTILVAELGGRAAALVTAVVSALSLNFFLTEPYLTLAITAPDDVIAFVGLAVCGLIAAAFGKRRERASEAAGRAGNELDVLKRLVEQLEKRQRLEDVLRHLQRSFGLRAVALRDAGDRIVAGVPPGSLPPEIPHTQIAPGAVFTPDEARVRFGAKGMRLPEDGARLHLGTGPDAWSLDVWEGDPDGMTLDESQTLTVAASMLGLALSRRELRAAPRA